MRRKKEVLFQKKYLIAFYDAKEDEELVAVLSLDEFAKLKGIELNSARARINQFLSGFIKTIYINGIACIPHLIDMTEEEE